ncbi:MAG: MATE family efflux transporter [Caldilineaceae bacterium]|nr:MATE family efflux transporter [Caldilineaceae bacterium]
MPTTNTQAKNAKRALLVQGPIRKTLVKLTVPMLFGIFGMVAFNLIDTFFVGRLGTNELAAMSFTFPVVLVVNGFALGLGVGTSAVVSRAIGEGNRTRVQRLTTDGLALAVLLVTLFVTVGLLTINPIFRLLGAPPEVMPLIRQYMTIWYLGAGFVVAPMVGNNAIRATGDTVTPSAIMMVAVAVNVILDPILIFGLGPFPRMELAGAAIATVIARAVTLLVALFILYYREKMITLVVPPVKSVWDSWKAILYIGLPTAGTNIIVPISVGIITSLVATYGSEAVAGLGVATRVESFALMMFMALNSVIGPFVGQNLGANQLERLKLGVKYSQQFAMAWGALMFVLLWVAAEPIALLFNDDPVVVSTVISYLRLVPVSYGLLGVFMLSSTTLNVLNKPMQAVALTILRTIILYVPLAYLGAALFGVGGIFGATALANVIAGGGAYLWLARGVLEKLSRPFSSRAAAEPA